jgi:hypothetical protein
VDGDEIDVEVWCNRVKVRLDFKFVAYKTTKKLDTEACSLQDFNSKPWILSNDAKCRIFLLETIKLEQLYSLLIDF